MILLLISINFLIRKVKNQGYIDLNSQLISKQNRLGLDDEKVRHHILRGQKFILLGIHEYSRLFDFISIIIKI